MRPSADTFAAAIIGGALLGAAAAANGWAVIGALVGGAIGFAIAWWDARGLIPAPENPRRDDRERIPVPLLAVMIGTCVLAAAGGVAWAVVGGFAGLVLALLEPHE